MVQISECCIWRRYGTYTLVGDKYSEHLEYCSYRGWENQDFSFKMEIRNDTIIQSGEEKIDS
ncbi:hypothetical protein [Chitinophaga pinensis]|uniref:Uncharacterized protein n=1 Tax=Chitinophaga pinensis TaxID=79329 RepID=A0A5C6LQR4_9BACT|nr:hypothetical protein [Chitinophaga pinensis]TWV99211.1 hypothetical protein FEF09_18275 [Chitinophaga pinensis]